MMNFVVISTGQQARAENVLSHFCSIHQADARVHKSKLQQLTGDQSDRNKAQNYCGRESEARGDDKQITYDYLKLGLSPKVAMSA